MKILVENAPNTCYECLFLGEVKNNTHSGCTLLVEHNTTSENCCSYNKQK